MRYLTILAGLLLILGCLSDSKDLITDTCEEYKDEGIDLKAELMVATNEWYSNNLELKPYQLDHLNIVSVPAIAEEMKWDLPMEIMIAQSILESGWGRSPLSKQQNNYFGIKEDNKRKSSATYSTHEYINGRRVSIVADFKVYPTPSYCFSDRSQWFLTNKRYKNVLSDDMTYKEFAYILQIKGYATDPDYAEKLISIVKRYKIDQYSNWVRFKLDYI